MQRQQKSEFDHATLEAMMERYRAELLRYQRATPPGKPTLAENLKGIAKEQPVLHKEDKPKVIVQSEKIPSQMESKAVVIPSPAQKQPATPKTQVYDSKTTVPVAQKQPYMGMTQFLTHQKTPQSQIKDQKNYETRTSLIEPVLPAAPPETILLPAEPQRSARSMVETTLEPEVHFDDEVELPNPIQEEQDVPLECFTEENAESTYATTSYDMPAEKTPEPPETPPEPPPETPPLNETIEEEPVTTVPEFVRPSIEEITPQPKYIATDNCRCHGHSEFEKGIGAYGTFRPYERMGQYTTASFLQMPGAPTPVLARFAADVPSGGADAIRCRRSFSVKFFCREGEYDLMGMHLPVSVGADDATLDECKATFRANPKTGLRTRTAFWEFLVAHTEALHATLWLYSDLGTIGSYRSIDGYGLPCLWINAKGEQHVVRTRWLSRQRPQTLTRFEAEELSGSDPDAVARDLIESISAGEKPQYELCIQIIPSEQLASLAFDPFDPTGIWPAEQFKLQKVGLMTLDRLPEHIENELQPERFGTGHTIAGVACAPAPAAKKEDDFTQARQYLRSLGEFSRHRLVDNLSEELFRLPPLLLEQVLILFSRADLEFGQAMTLALGG